MRGSASTRPVACNRPRAVSSLRLVAALPMSIWPQAMLYCRPSKDSERVSPVSACLVEASGASSTTARPRHMRRDRAVVDDAPALRILRLHHAEGVLGAQAGAG